MLINVWSIDQDGRAVDEDRVLLPNIHLKDGGCTQFGPDGEELDAVRHILDLLATLHNDEAIVITRWTEPTKEDQ